MKNVHIDLSQDTRINRIIIALYEFGGAAKLKSLYSAINTSDWVDNNNPEAKIRQYLQRNTQLFQPVVQIDPTTRHPTKGVWGLTDAARQACTRYFQQGKDQKIQSLEQELQAMKQEVDALKHTPTTTVLQINTTSVDVSAQTTKVISQKVEQGATLSAQVPDYSQLTEAVLVQALFQLQDERYMQQGQELPLISQGSDWFYVGRILYETGFFQIQFYTALETLLKKAVQTDDTGHDVHLRYVVSRTTLSREGQHFGQPSASFFSSDPHKQWHVVADIFSANDLLHAQAIASRFVQIVAQLL